MFNRNRILPIAAVLAALAGQGVAADLDAIKDSGVLRALTTGNDRPNVYMNEAGEPVGFEVDMCNAIAERLGVTLDLDVLAWEGLLTSLTSGRTDMICSGVNITKARAEAFDFSVPYSRTAVIAMIKPDAEDSNSLEGKMVGTVIGADGEDVVRATGGFKDIRVYPGSAAVFADFVAGRLDVGVIGDKQAAEFIQERPGVARIASEPFKVNLVGYPLTKDDSEEFKVALDEIITDLRKSGALNEMAKKAFDLDNFDAALPPLGQGAQFD